MKLILELTLDLAAAVVVIGLTSITVYAGPDTVNKICVDDLKELSALIKESRDSTTANFNLAMKSELRSWSRSELRAFRKVLPPAAVLALKPKNDLNSNFMSYELSEGDSFASRFNGFQLNAQGSGIFNDASVSPLNAALAYFRKVSETNLIVTDDAKFRDAIAKSKLDVNYVSAQKHRKLIGYASGVFEPEDGYAAMRRVFQIMAPRTPGGVGTYSILYVFAKLSQSKEFIVGATKGVTKVLERLNAANQKKAVEGDLFSDLVTGFLEVDPDLDTAQQNAFALLGLYGTRGPNLAGFIKLLEKFETDTSTTTSGAILARVCAMLGSAVPAIDIVAVKTGRLYSMPKTVSAHIDYARPYHFWLSVYLVHRLMSEGYNPQASARAVMRAGLLYELFAAVGTNERAFNEITFNETRKDLVFNDAGAIWAAQSTNAVDINELYSPEELNFRDRLASLKIAQHGFRLVFKKLGLKPASLRSWMTTITPFTVEREAERQAGFSVLNYLHPAPLKPLFDTLAAPQSNK